MTPRVRQFTLWPGGLIGRVILVLLAALVLEFAGSTLLYEQTAVLLPSNASLDELAHRLLRVERGLSYLPADTRQGLAEAVSGDGLHLAWSSTTALSDRPADGTPLPLSFLRGQLLRLQPDLALHDLQLESGSEAVSGLSRNVAGRLRLDDGTTLHFTVERLVDFPGSLYDTLLSTTVFAGSILLAAAMVVYTLAAPLRRLAQIAGTIGRGSPVYVAEKEGPREVRQCYATIKVRTVLPHPGMLPWEQLVASRNLFPRPRRLPLQMIAVAGLRGSAAHVAGDVARHAGRLRATTVEVVGQHLPLARCRGRVA